MGDAEVLGPLRGPATRKNRKHQNRIFELARPKEPKSIWITSTGPRVQWGTQETLWPVTQEALQASTTPRLEELSEAKKNFQEGQKVNRPEFIFSCGRSSMIWKVSDGALQAEPTPRLQELSLAKRVQEEYQDDRPHYVFSCGRSSPIWQVSNSAREERDRPLTESLARPKTVHMNYRPLRDVRTEIPPRALNSIASPRLLTLSGPKNRDEGPFRDPIWPVAKGARLSTPTGRCMELARPKPLADGYLPARSVVWDVPRAAKKANTTTRLDELSNPIIRATMDHLQFDPDAFIVKEAALKGRCSARVEELSAPILR